MLGVGAGFGAAGTYMCGKEAITEFVTQKENYDKGKQCVEKVEAGQTCSAEEYDWAARYAGQKQTYGMGLSWLFGGASFVRMALPKVRRPRKPGEEKKP